MDEAIRAFLEHLEAERRSAANTLVAYRADLQQLARFLAGRLARLPAVGDLSVGALTSYVEWLGQQGYRATTVSRKTAAVRSFLDFIGSRLHVDAPGLTAALHSPPAPKKRPKVLSEQEVAALIQAPNRLNSPRGLRDTALLSLLYATGLRATEAVSLRLEDIDLAGGIVFRRGPTPAEDQALPLGLAIEPLQRYVRAGRPHLVRSPEQAALFLNQRGQRLSRQGLWLVIKRWAQASGLQDRISPHTLRHTLADHLLASGRPRRQVQHLLGLSSPNTLSRRAEESDRRKTE